MWRSLIQASMWGEGLLVSCSVECTDPGLRERRSFITKLYREHCLKPPCDSPIQPLMWEVILFSGSVQFHQSRPPYESLPLQASIREGLLFLDSLEFTNLGLHERRLLVYQVLYRSPIQASMGEGLSLLCSVEFTNPCLHEGRSLVVRLRRVHSSRPPWEKVSRCQAL